MLSFGGEHTQKGIRTLTGTPDFFSSWSYYRMPTKIRKNIIWGVANAWLPLRIWIPMLLFGGNTRRKTLERWAKPLISPADPVTEYLPRYEKNIVLDSYTIIWGKHTQKDIRTLSKTSIFCSWSYYRIPARIGAKHSLSYQIGSISTSATDLDSYAIIWGETQAEWYWDTSRNISSGIWGPWVLLHALDSNYARGEQMQELW